MPQDKCRCPVRPYYALGSFGSGSTGEDALVKQWGIEHGDHSYAKVRDDLATALQMAQGRIGSGEAVLDMVHDVFGLERVTEKAA